MKKLCSLFLCLCLAACTPLYLLPEEIEPTPHTYPQLPNNETLKGKVQLGTVNVAPGPELSGPINVENYKTALQKTLSGAGYLVQPNASATFLLEASLLEINLDGCYSIDGLAKAKYVLKRADTQKAIWEETITLPSHVSYVLFSNAARNIRLASALALRENLTHLIRVLASQQFTSTPNSGDLT